MSNDAAACTFERYEMKYLIPEGKAGRFLAEISERMHVDSFGRTTVMSLYCDTDRDDLILRSIGKPYYKEKLRVRSYGIPEGGSHVFVEMKRKCGSTVYKRRTSMTLDEAGRFLLDGTLPQDGQIEMELAYFRERYRLLPKMVICSDRTGYAGNDEPFLRLTIDRSVRYRTEDLRLDMGDGGQELLDRGSLLAEIKIPGSMPLWLTDTLSSLKLYPSPFSKYGEAYKRIHQTEGSGRTIRTEEETAAFWRNGRQICSAGY